MFGSWARGDEDDLLDVDPQVATPEQRAAMDLAHALLDTGLADEGINLSEQRWRRCAQDDDPDWHAIADAAIRLDPPETRD